MASVQKINQNQSNKSILTPKNTGYLAMGALTLASLRGLSVSKQIKKSHKIFGILALLLTLLHIGCVEYLHHKYKKM